MMKNLRTFFALVLSMALIGGCASAPQISDNQKLVDMLHQGGLVTEETERGVVVYLPALFFDYGSADLLEEARDKIRYIADAVNEDFAIKRNIAVEGHTDSKGDESYNFDLSKKRALSVADELTFSKVDPARLEIDWFGETAPLAPNANSDGSDNPEGRAKNRRVEFIILNSADA